MLRQLLGIETDVSSITIASNSRLSVVSQESVVRYLPAMEERGEDTVKLCGSGREEKGVVF